MIVCSGETLRQDMNTPLLIRLIVYPVGIG